MRASKEFTEYILDLLSPVGDIQTSRMFGGVLLKVEGRQLGVIFGEELFFKVMGADLQVKYKAAGSKQFTYTRKDKVDPVIIKNWWSVPEPAMDNSEEMVRLAKEVIDQP